MKKMRWLAVAGLLAFPGSLAAQNYDWQGTLSYPTPGCANKPTSGTIAFYSGANCTGSSVTYTFSDANPGFFQICDNGWAPASAQIDLPGSCYDQCVGYSIPLWSPGNLCGPLNSSTATKNLCVSSVCD